ncbi:MAG: hypothetical protein A49_13310 [Methyloceanibacter sp.]|nr:MAG: hypothetical protein A49_13310 [Methyloceanibacter sp.]
MALSDAQIRQLRAKLDPRHVKTRRAGDNELSYVEGWHVVAEANRIFGFDAWDRRTISNTCIWAGSSGNGFAASYVAKVRIVVRAGDTSIVRDGSGCGDGKAQTRGEAHDLALKAAETDATKRALATFGNRFGLALYDPTRSGVGKCKIAEKPELPSAWTLRPLGDGTAKVFTRPSDFVAALRDAMSAATTIEGLFALWEQNVDDVRTVNRVLRQEHLPKSGAAPQLVEHLKRCASELATPKDQVAEDLTPHEPDRERSNGSIEVSGGHRRVDKSALTISEPRRIRNKAHLQFVAQQPCLICGRRPSHAHHVRHAQSRGLALKVSDEFTVPLCAIHHGDLHRVGKEETWWWERGVEPLAVARSLWQSSVGRECSSAGEQRDGEPEPEGKAAPTSAGSPS